MAVARNLNLPPEAEREKGYFREDIYLKTGLRCRNALERPKTQQTFLHFCSLCFFFLPVSHLHVHWLSPLALSQS